MAAPRRPSRGAALSLVLALATAGCNVLQRPAGLPDGAAMDAPPRPDQGQPEATSDRVDATLTDVSDAAPPIDVVLDTPADRAADTGADTGLDARVDTGTDTGLDAGADTGLDTGSDTGTDVRTDTGADTGLDVRVDTGVDTGADTGTDLGTDTGMDTGMDTGTDGACGARGGPCCAGWCEAGLRCAFATCIVLACSTGLNACGGNCVDTQVSASHCGACDRACSSSQVCLAGGCVEHRSCTLAPPLPPGCGLVDVPAGTFTMGAATNCPDRDYDPSCAADGAPPIPGVSVDRFAVDAYEVTVARFRAFWAARLADGGATTRSRPIAYPGGVVMVWSGAASEPPTGGEFNWTPTPGPATREAHPINGVDFWTAQEFCVWDGGRLPTEAEWEYVARGRVGPGFSTGRIYPWGDTPPTLACDRAHWNGCEGEDGGRTRRVGRFAASLGVFDLAGNVWELVADTVSTGRLGCWGSVRNPICLEGATLPSAEGYARGGSCGTIFEPQVRAASRVSGPRTLRNSAVGFRCVRAR